MNLWRKDIAEEVSDARADKILPKKRRKQTPGAKGLSAVSIGRRDTRSTHQRNEDRYVLSGTKAVAKIDEDKHDVEILNLSSNGVMIAHDGAPEIGQRISIAFDDCAPISAEIRWIRAGRIGMEFAAETVIIAEAGVQDFIIKTISRDRAAAHYQPDAKIGAEQRGVDQRHDLVWLGKLCWGAHSVTARLRNVSATGAMVSVSSDVSLTRGDQVELVLETIGKTRGSIRWIAGKQIGIEFAEAFDVSGLVHEACAQLAPQDDAQGLAPNRSRPQEMADEGDDMTVRLGMVENPHCTPDMQYGRLTIDEVYATLYPNGKPVADTSES